MGGGGGMEGKGVLHRIQNYGEKKREGRVSYIALSPVLGQRPPNHTLYYVRRFDRRSQYIATEVDCVINVIKKNKLQEIDIKKSKQLELK